MIHRYLIAAALLASCGSLAAAQDVRVEGATEQAADKVGWTRNGNTFLEHCPADRPSEGGVDDIPDMLNWLTCMAYFNGFSRGIFYLDSVNSVQSICIPSGVNTMQLIAMVRKNLVDRPAIRNESLNDIIYATIIINWKCKD